MSFLILKLSLSAKFELFSGVLILSDFWSILLVSVATGILTTLFVSTSTTTLSVKLGLGAGFVLLLDILFTVLLSESEGV